MPRHQSNISGLATKVGGGAPYMVIDMDKEKIRKGIGAYKREQQVLLRLISKTGGLTASKFDELYQGREYRKRVRLSPRKLSYDSFILGMGINGGSMWAENLDLLQRMMAIDLVTTERNEQDEIVYKLQGSGK